MPAAAIQEARACLDASSADRGTLALTMLKNGIVAFFPDVAARVIGDLEKAGARDNDIRPVLAMATHERLLDVPAQKALRTALKRHPALVRALDRDIALAERLLKAAASDAGVGSPTRLAG
jgi:hypothetical protein